MSTVFDVYKNIPGMLVTFKDGGLSSRGSSFTSEEAQTDSMIILGTASDGPIMEPIAVDDSSVKAVFGTGLKSNGIPDGSTLLKAYRQARARGCNDIRLMRVTGSNAKLQLKGQDIVATSEEFKTKDFTTITGNDETTINLQNTNLVKDSVKVYIEDSQLLTGYTVVENDGTVVISSGVGRAGAAVSFEYKYIKDKAITEETHTAITDGSSTITITLDNEVKAGSTMTVQNATKSAEVTSTDYSLGADNKTITFTANVDDADEIKVSYTTQEESAVVTETGDVLTGTTYSLKTSDVSVTFDDDETPAGEIKLIVNGTVSADQSVLSYDAATKTATVNKSDFEIGDVLTLRYNVELVETTTPIITLRSYCGGSVYNEGTVTVEKLVNESGLEVGRKVIISKPNSKKTSIEKDLEYSSLDYPTFGMLVDAINTDSGNGLYQAETEFEDLETAELVEMSSTTFTGGEDGINVTKQEMYEALSGKRDEEGYLIESGAYQILEDYQVDWIVPVGVYADDELLDPNQNFAYQLALLCAVLSYRNKTTLGCIAMSPNKDRTLAGVQAYAKKCANYNNYIYLLDSDNKVYTDADGNAMDLGRYISICVGPEAQYTDSELGSYYGNPAIDYIAYNTMILPESAPTNKTLPKAKSLKYSFSNAQLNAITGNRMVTFRSKNDRNNNKSVVIVDGVTCAAPNSDYTRLTSFKVIRYIVDDIREVADPYIGEPNTVENRNALSAAISKRLSIHKTAGRILDSEFQLIATAEDVLIGEAELELTIVPPQELRRITTVVGLKASL